MVLVNDIKDIINKSIKKLYFNYLNENLILYIESIDLKKIITNIYDKNVQQIKKDIRNELKEKMKDDYPSGSIENILLDIFEDKNININKLFMEIDNYQKSIVKDINLQIFDKLLGIKININNFVEIISTTLNHNNIEIQNKYNLINEYKYIHSINSRNLFGITQNKIIEILQSEVKNNDSVNLRLVK